MLLYHASPINNLHEIGLSLGKRAINSRSKTNFYIYLGTVNYILNQYFKYTPYGIYSLYSINVDNLELEALPTGEQWRVDKEIRPEKISKIAVYDVRKNIRKVL